MIDIICSNGHMFSIRASVETKVVVIKGLLAEITIVSANDQRLIYKETVLEDDQTLRSYGLQAHHVIHLEEVRKPPFAGTQTTPPSNTTIGKLMDEEMIMIEIVCSNGDIFSVGTSVRSKVADFKNLLARFTSLPAINQRLTYKGIILEDHQTLCSYGLQVDHAIHLEVVRNPLFATTPPSTGGLGLPGLDRPTGVMPDMMIQLIPTFFQMMQSFLSNPQFMKLIADQNPQLHGMLDSNSQLIEMMQNPQVVRQLQMLQQMMSSSLLPDLNQQSPLGIVQPGDTAVPPEQLYATQLSQLQEMRFFDT